MHNTFISLVGVVNHHYELIELPIYLRNAYEALQAKYTDFEIIIINNALGREIEERINSLPLDIKQHIYLLNLSTPANRNHALLAGLDRANGDYTIVFELIFAQQSELIHQLFEKSQTGYDIVYLQAQNRTTKIGILYKVFYFILRKYSELKVDEKAHDTRIISRRALNSLLRLRENLRYMKAIYGLVGYQTTTIPTDMPIHDYGDSFSNRVRTSLVAITSFTNFFRALSLWIFLSSLTFALVAIFNAFLVRLTNYDIFGDYHEAISGWSFLVVLISVFFSVMFLNLYIVSIYLANIYKEMKARPMYILESVKRF